MADLLHALTCPVRARYRRRHYGQPFWKDDRVAKQLSVAHLGCPRCGKGAIPMSRWLPENQQPNEDEGDPYTRRYD